MYLIVLCKYDIIVILAKKQNNIGGANVSKRIICASLGPEGSCRYANIKVVNENHYACCTHPETKRERIGKVEEHFPCYAP